MTAGWSILDGFANPVPANMGAALRALGIEVLRVNTRVDDRSEELCIRCPEHAARTGKEDRKPSCWINSVSGAFVCFSCGYSGPFVVLAADRLGCDRAAAAVWTAAYGVRSVLQRTDDATAPTIAQHEVIRITEAAIALYVPPPRKALDSRHLTEQAAADYGVLWNEEHRRWILPIRDPDTGELWGWQEKGKRFFKNHPDGVKKSLSLFGWDTLGDEDQLILLESPLDAVRLASHGIPGAVASYGAHVSAAQMNLIRRRGSRLIVALDNDRAGYAAADRIARLWRQRGVPMRFLSYHHTTAKDIGAMSAAEIDESLATLRLTPYLRAA
jgi:hypothetical protein